MKTVDIWQGNTGGCNCNVKLTGQTISWIEWFVSKIALFNKIMNIKLKNLL